MRATFFLTLAFTLCLTSSVIAEKAPSFSLAWSEYPSWSTFGVANELKMIDGQKGKLGPIEEKWKVDIILKEADYDSCIAMYGSLGADAVCITNMDALRPSLTRQSVAVLPTSTSYGADACIVVGINNVKELRGVKVYGLSKSVSEYCFVRNLEQLGEKESDHKFTNMDPAAAALAMQQQQTGFNAIMVWNPFVLETLNKRKDAKVLFDSTTIPNEIIDMVVIAQESLDKPGGNQFACAVIDTFYAINRRLEDPKTADDTLIALGEKFSHLDLQSMRKVVRQTLFYKTPKDALKLFTGEELPEIMKLVIEFCVSHDITPEKPTTGYGTKEKFPDVKFRFDPSYIKELMPKE
ncbi:hypothetical protein FJZ31_18940 [Candidatus Poribacteria bacterium]|nr:hypothetical protein [Candidatus Poribacteria bacterium]